MARKGGKRERATLAYDRDIYNYAVLKMAQPLSSQEMRQEYSRLRSIAQKRLKRLGDSEWSDSQIYLNNKNLFPMLSEVKDDSELAKRLSLLATFITSERGSVSGLNRERRKTIETLHDRGYTFVNKTNFKAFTSFMEDTRLLKAEKQYDSKRVAELFKTGEKLKISPEELLKNFESWMENLDKLKDIADNLKKNENPKSSAKYRKELGIVTRRKMRK